jgi:hypothetical protein
MSSSSGAFLKNLVAGADSQKTSLNIVLSIASILSLILLGLIIAQIVKATTPGQGASATDAISISIYVLAALAALAWIIYGVYKSKFDHSPLGEVDKARNALASVRRQSASSGAAAQSLDVPTNLDASSDVGGSAASASAALGGAGGAGGAGGLVDTVRGLAANGGRGGNVGQQLLGLAKNPQLQQMAGSLAGANPVAQRVVGAGTSAINAL